jgi:tetratricopeptide (TPR) repeat protein
VRNQRPEAKDEIAPLLDRAMRLAGTASENEALFIRGSGHVIRLAYREAVPYLEALFKADPQHPWAAGNLSLAYSRAGDSEKIPAFARQLQAARPNDPAGYWLAAESGLCSTDSSTALIGQAADRAVDLVSQRGDERQLLSAKLRSLLTHAAAEWSEGRLDSTRKMLDQARELLRAGPLGSHHLHVGAGYMALGMRREAESLFALEHSDTFRNNWIWWPALQQGDLPAVRSGIGILDQVPPHPLHAFVALRAGSPELAAVVLRRQEQLAVTTTPFAVSAAKGELALQRGRFEEAIRILEPALADLGKRSLAEGTFGSQALSRAFRRAHRDDEAIRVLEAETGRPRACGGFLRAAFWLPARLELLQLLEAQGRGQDVGAIRRELVQYTQLADPRYLVKQHVGGAPPAAAVR